MGGGGGVSVYLDSVWATYWYTRIWHGFAYQLLKRLFCQCMHVFVKLYYIDGATWFENIK